MALPSLGHVGLTLSVLNTNDCGQVGCHRGPDNKVYYSVFDFLFCKLAYLKSAGIIMYFSPWSKFRFVCGPHKEPVSPYLIMVVSAKLKVESLF